MAKKKRRNSGGNKKKKRNNKDSDNQQQADTTTSTAAPTTLTPPAVPAVKGVSSTDPPVASDDNAQTTTCVSEDESSPVTLTLPTDGVVVHANAVVVAETAAAHVEGGGNDGNEKSPTDSAVVTKEESVAVAAEQPQQADLKQEDRQGNDDKGEVVVSVLDSIASPETDPVFADSPVEAEVEANEEELQTERGETVALEKEDDTGEPATDLVEQTTPRVLEEDETAVLTLDDNKQAKEAAETALPPKTEACKELVENEEQDTTKAEKEATELQVEAEAMAKAEQTGHAVEADRTEQAPTETASEEITTTGAIVKPAVSIDLEGAPSDEFPMPEDEMHSSPPSPLVNENTTPTTEVDNAVPKDLVAEAQTANEEKKEKEPEQIVADSASMELSTTEDVADRKVLAAVPSDESIRSAQPEEPKPSTRVAASTLSPRPSGMTFAAAFGKSPAPAVSPLASPPATAPSIDLQQSVSPLDVQESHSSNDDTHERQNSASHSALSASVNKRVSGLLSKYVETVAHEPLPGDAVPLVRTASNPSNLNPAMYSPTPSPMSLQAPRKFLEIDAEKLPDVNSVKEMFENSSRHSESNEFEFGESFRQKKRFEQLSGKAQEREAKAALHGFDEKEMFQGRTASGEVDTSSLGKIFTFELSSNESISLSDGTCRVDYKNIDYKAMVFVVHRTRGMLLLHVNMPTSDTDSIASTKSKRAIPGGSVMEDEFLSAAKQSGSSQVQLQIAAREAAARQLYEKTGLDMRDNVDRFKPAVLKVNPPVDARGVQYLKNEHANKLYYFLQVDEDDFAALAAAEESNGDPARLVRPTEDTGDSALTLKLASDYGGFTFVQDPAAAAKVLKTGGSMEATTALRMIMNEAENDVDDDDDEHSRTPDAKATEYSSKTSGSENVPADERKGTLDRTVGGKEGEPERNDEADLKVKPSTDTHDAVAVECCCGWW